MRAFLTVVLSNILALGLGMQNQWCALLLIKMILVKIGRELFTLKQGSDADATLKKLPKVDLTVVEFTNSQKYSVAKIANSDLAVGTKAEDFFIRGEDKYQKGDYQGAIAAYTQAIALNPNYAQAYHNRGIPRSNLGDEQGAVADYNQARAN